MRVIIVDDEALARALLREYLAAHPDIDIVAECRDGFEAVKAIAELAPDLVLLDIQMPQMSGFEVLALAGGATRYLFVTAFDQHAVKAFEVRAVDYLLKPFSQQRFDTALANARAAVTPVERIDAVVRDAQASAAPLERLLIRDGARVHVLATGDIEVIEAQDDYIEISAGGKRWLKNQRLAELEAQLDPRRHVRVHRSWIVSLAKLLRIEAHGKDSHVCVMADGRVVPVSRSGYQKLRELLA
ncbi:LytR/AlgR family response regulator transcription factor [Massilia sp. DWR3-1-1]|uniref:LytR/AlgR family response regulator transcription factor n=1 Tax=Massilia sp. DWR3-1-1 TaxID=2804559 RepID=UPI003CF12553